MHRQFGPPALKPVLIHLLLNTALICLLIEKRGSRLRTSFSSQHSSFRHQGVRWYRRKVLLIT